MSVLHGRKRWVCQRFGGERKECDGVVVSCNAVCVDGSTFPASVQEHPFAVGSNGDGDGLHFSSATGGPVSGGDVEVYAPEAVRAVIAVARAGCVGVKGAAAVAAADSHGHWITNITGSVVTSGRELRSRTSADSIKRSANESVLSVRSQPAAPCATRKR